LTRTLVTPNFRVAQRPLALVVVGVVAVDLVDVRRADCLGRRRC